MTYRRTSPYSIWNEMNQLQREMDRLMRGSFPSRTRPAPTFPALNIWTNDDGAVVTAEIPGIDINDIDISVVGETLSINGSREPDMPEENVRFHRQERGYGKFSRSIQLPFTVESGHVEATYKNGILKIMLPRAEAEKPKKITVKTA